MNYTTYGTADEFLEKAEEYLIKDEASNNLMLGICNKIRDNKGLYKGKPYFSTLEADEKPMLAAVMTPPKKLILYGTRYNEDDLETFCNHIIRDGISLPGVNGEASLVKRFAEVWSGLNNCNFKPGMNMRIYRLDRVRYRGTAKGYLRPAEEKDTELIADWIQGFNRDAGLEELSREDAVKSTAFNVEKKLLYIWEDGNSVSMAGYTRETEHGKVIAYVYTPEEYRNKGYATACVAALSQLILDSGKKFCALFTDLSNPVSNSIYMKIGYEPLCDFDEYIFY